MLGIPVIRMFSDLPSELTKKHSRVAGDIAARFRKAYAACDRAVIEQAALIGQRVIPRAEWEASIDCEVAAHDAIWEIKKEQFALITLIIEEEVAYNANIAQRDKKKRIKALRKELAELESNLED